MSTLCVYLVVSTVYPSRGTMSTRVLYSVVDSVSWSPPVSPSVTFLPVEWVVCVIGHRGRRVYEVGTGWGLLNRSEDKVSRRGKRVPPSGSTVELGTDDREEGCVDLSSARSRGRRR